MSNNPPPPGTIDEPDDARPAPIWPPPNRKALPACLDPYIKNPEYERYRKQMSRSRSRSPDRRSRHRRDRRRRSRSRSSSHERSRRHRRKEPSRHRKSNSDSRSPSPSRDRKSSRKSPSPHSSRSDSRERTRRRSTRTRSKSRESSHITHDPHYHSRRRRHRDLEAAVAEEEEVEQPKENAFKNDGSFMEMFKKMQEEQQQKQMQELQENPMLEAAVSGASGIVPPRPFAGIGKRRGGRILKTGIVAKPKVEEDNADEEGQDAWSIYLQEVKRYKAACCDDDSKTRPLVK